MKTFKNDGKRLRFALSPWWGWMLLTCFCVFQFALQGVVGILADSLKESFPLDAKSLSLLSSSFYYSYILIQIPVGFIFDRFGVRVVAASALVLTTISCLAFAMSSSIPFAIGARVLMGFGCAFGFIGLMVGIGRWFDRKYFALLVACTECFAMCAVAGTNAGLSRLVIAYDWRIVMYLCAAVAFVLAVLTLLFVKRDTVTEADNRIPMKDALATVVRSKGVWLGGLFSFSVFAVVTVFAGLWAIPFFMNAGHMDLVTASSVVSMVFVGVAISSPIVGWLSSFLRCSSLMIPGALATMLLMFTVLYGSHSLVGSYLLMLSIGMATAVYQLPFVLVNRTLSPAIQGVAMGMTNMVTMLSGPLLQPLIGFILAGYGGNMVDAFEDYPLAAYHVALAVIPACLGVAAILAWNLEEKGYISLGSWLRQLWARSWARI